MPKKNNLQAADFITPLCINGLEGRMLYKPSKKRPDRDILLIYGHHAMIERWWGLIENLELYGNVTVPDLPGFGGMDSLAKIGIKPNTDDLAEYLASFVKLRYRRKRVTIYAISYGFAVVTRMLQLHPELCKKVDVLICVVGFMHGDDFHWSHRRRTAYRTVTRFFAARPIPFLIRYLALNKFVIKTLTSIIPHSKQRFIEQEPLEFDKTMDFEVVLWQANDVRTHWLTTSEFLHLDNTKTRVDLPVVHVISEGDHYFNNVKVEEHMRKVFSDYQQFIARTNAHTPHVTADKKDMAVMVPRGLRRLLSQKSNV